jgi:hypothetical protein
MLPILRIEHENDPWYVRLSGHIELELHERTGRFVTLHLSSALETDDAEVDVASCEPPTARLGRRLILRSKRGGLFFRGKALKGCYCSDRSCHEARSTIGRYRQIAGMADEHPQVAHNLLSRGRYMRIGFLNHPFFDRSYSAGPGEVSIPFLAF